VLYASFGAILAAGRLAFRRNLLAHLLQGVQLPEPVWARLTWAWIGFFAAMAAANWYVAFHFTTDAWVTFKVWGGIGLLLVFALLQGLWLARHMPDEPARQETPR
jgi:intracellular septation protein